MLENQDFSQVFPSGAATDCPSSGMPYLCTLAEANGMALNFYSNAHGSLLAYLFNTSGADWKGKPWDCTGSGCSSAGVIKEDNIVRALNKTSKTWRGYFESMPRCGYMGSSSGNYTQHHNPFKWYSDVADSPSEQDNMCPFSQLATDISTNALPNFGYIVPNEADDAEGTGSQSASALLSKADNWIKTNIGPGPETLLSSDPFQPGGDGILIVTFDEARVKGKSGDKSSDDACSPTQSSGCGGHVAFVMIGPNVIAHSTANSTYHFQDMLHTMLHLLGITDYMNGANGAADIALLPGAGG
jgi:acid phosphatase